jgi:hypothetical protein
MHVCTFLEVLEDARYSSEVSLKGISIEHTEKHGASAKTTGQIQGYEHQYQSWVAESEMRCTFTEAASHWATNHQCNVLILSGIQWLQKQRDKQKICSQATSTHLS